MLLLKSDEVKLTAGKVMRNTSATYLLLAGVCFGFFYLWKRKKYLKHKIQQRFPEQKHIIREIKYSTATVLVFTGMIMFVVFASKKGWTRIYKPADKYGRLYYLASIMLMIIMHDSYFYWTHRLMHWKPLFKSVHRIHHLSNNPTPFAAYAFHPLEAVVEAGIIPLVAFTVPYHRSAMGIFSLYSLMLNVLGHLGYELFPQGFASHRLFKWHNTSTHHNMHHRLVKYNYGLYFNFWDRMMNTNHPDYEQNFDKLAGRRNEFITGKGLALPV